ncbi:VOC family protein [Microbacteriaceae bacterium VKM Ac-2855]|nr:VOC family protein [Microbacteriaceae bacterium VKM Ac-2855]
MERTYPPGVTCWIDTEQPDTNAAAEFYGGLFGWTFENAMPPGAPAVYLIAQLDGSDVAAIGGGTGGTGASSRWNSYIAVADADAGAAAVRAAGGSVLAEPEDAGPGGRPATCADPQGAEFRLWQARRRLGAQTVNAPGAWNFSNLRTADIDAAEEFYGRVFGWRYADLGPDAHAMITVPGYGDHLAATVDPDIRKRQADAPPEFADAIGGIERSTEAPHWHVILSVADRTTAVGRALKLGATLLDTHDTVYAELARIRDPQGAELTLSAFRW